jgi:hypothetical protein
VPQVKPKDQWNKKQNSKAFEMEEFGAAYSAPKLTNSPCF